MKILVIMEGFFPGKKYGGPPVSVDNFCSLMNNYECFIYTTNHDLGECTPYPEILEDVWVDRGNCKVKYVSNKHYCNAGFANIIEEVQPDVIYLQGLFQSCIFPCLLLANKYSIRVVLAPRGELCAGALSIHTLKKRLYIYLVHMLGLVRNVVFQSTSKEETEAIHKYLSVPFNRIKLLENIPSIPKYDYKRAHKKNGKCNIIFLSRIHPKKNLLSAIHYLKAVRGDVRFDIYGPIEDDVYWESCKEEIALLPQNINVNYCGLISHSDVHEVFSQYDVFLFPTISENYGHVIAEALSVGTPVIISDQTPWNDVEKNNCGKAIPLSSPGLFTSAIQSIVDYDELQLGKITDQCKSFFNEKNELKKIHDAYEDMFHI